MGGGNSRRQRVLEPYTSFDVLPTEYFNRRAFQQQCSPLPPCPPGLSQSPPYLALPIPIPVPCPPAPPPPPPQQLNCLPQPSCSPPLPQYLMQNPPPNQQCLPQQKMCPPGCVPVNSSQQNLYLGPPPPRQAYPCPPSPSLCYPGTQSMSTGFNDHCGTFNQSQVFNTRPFGYMGQQGGRFNTIGRHVVSSASGVNSGGFPRYSSRNYAPALSHQEIQSVPKFNQQIITYSKNIDRISRSNMRNILL